MTKEILLKDIRDILDKITTSRQYGYITPSDKDEASRQILAKAEPLIRAEYEKQIAELKEESEARLELINRLAVKCNELKIAIGQARADERARIKSMICEKGFLTRNLNGHGYLVTDELWVELFPNTTKSGKLS